MLTARPPAFFQAPNFQTFTPLAFRSVFKFGTRLRPHCWRNKIILDFACSILHNFTTLAVVADLVRLCFALRAHNLTAKAGGRALRFPTKAREEESPFRSSTLRAESPPWGSTITAYSTAKWQHFQRLL